MRMMENAQDEKRSPGQRKMNYVFTTPKKKSSKSEPYVPPHRRIQVNGDESGTALKQTIPKPALPPGYRSPSEHRNDRDYDYRYTEYSSFAYPNKNSKNHQTIDSFLDFKKNFHLSNGTGSSQVEDNTDNGNQIVQRILQLVHVNTGLKEILDGLYEQAYGERLPPDFLNRWKFNNTLQSDSQSLMPNRKFSDSIQRVKVSPAKTVPASLALHRLDKEFWVVVHKCQSVLELWGIIMDKNHLGEVEKLSNEMQTFYEQLKTSDDQVVSGSYYALYDGSWHRVQCLQRNDTVATVLFIDRGDQDVKPVNQLHVLSSEFCSLPAQAVKMSLAGLEIFADFKEMQPILIRHLIDKSTYAKVDAVAKDHLVVQLYTSEEENDDEGVSVNGLIVDQMLKILDPRLYIEYDKLVPVEVCNIKNGIYVQLDVPSYKYIGLLMEKAVKECSSNKNLHRQVVVRHEQNTIYLVKSNEDQKWYRGKIIKFLSEHELQVFLIDVGSIAETTRDNVIHLEKVCSILAKYPAQAIQVQLDQIPHLDSKMQTTLQKIISRRKNLFVKIVSVGDNNNLPIVQLKRETDSGFHVTINDHLLLSLDDDKPKDDKLAQPSSLSVNGSTESMRRPHSATESIRPPQSATESIRPPQSATESIRPPRSVEPVLAVQKSPLKAYSTSSVKSAKSLSSYKSNASINSNTTQFNGNDITMQLSSVLKAPKLPEDDYFDVHVTLASDPSHFVIQLLRDKTLKFHKMVVKMSEACRSYRGPTLTCESIKVGQLYACKLSESNNSDWCRACVTEVKDKVASVYCCDYGSYKSVDIKNMVPLDKKFYKLPYQAIWAELHGVKSTDKEWSVRSCLRFQELTQSRDLVSRVISKRNAKTETFQKSTKIPVEVIYNVELIDTSSCYEDLNIGHLLIGYGVAEKI